MSAVGDKRVTKDNKMTKDTKIGGVLFLLFFLSIYTYVYFLLTCHSTMDARTNVDAQIIIHTQAPIMKRARGTAKFTTKLVFV